jgi:anti-sigma factor RsiW
MNTRTEPTRDDLLLYAAGELPPDRAAAIERRLRKEAEARRALEQLRGDLRRLSSLQVEPLPAALRRRITAAAFRARRRRRWAWVGVAAAAAAAAAAVVLAVLLTMHSPPAPPAPQGPQDVHAPDTEAVLNRLANLSEDVDALESELVTAGGQDLDAALGEAHERLNELDAMVGLQAPL